MTLDGKADALLKLDRAEEAEDVVKAALAEAKAQGSLGYQAELTLRLGLIALHRKDMTRALDAMAHAAEYARTAGGNRILAGIAMERARVLRAGNRTTEGEAAIREGVRASRSMGERLLLPRLLAELADIEISTGRRADAVEVLAEADDLLEGLLTNASSPWVRGRILASMDEIVSARIRLEGERNASNPTRLFAVVERARGRSLVELLHARPLSDLTKPEELRKGERRITALQLQLLRTTSRPARKRLLDQIFIARGTARADGDRDVRAGEPIRPGGQQSARRADGPPAGRTAA
jgi:tetratricopeptide (TPR) repeat protein